MGNPNFLEVMFHYFCDKIITNLLKLMKSPSLTKYKDFASLIEDKERSEAENTPATRKMQLIIKETNCSITKEDLSLRHGIRYVCSITMNTWVHHIGFRYETRKKLLHRNNDKDTTIEYWWKFVNIYIDYERRAYRRGSADFG